MMWCSYINWSIFLPSVNLCTVQFTYTFIELVIFHLGDKALVLHLSLFAAAMDKNLW